MITLHEHRQPTGHWTCENCGLHNYPLALRCYECDADEDGNIPANEEAEAE